MTETLSDMKVAFASISGDYKHEDVKEFIKDSIEGVEMDLVIHDGSCMECGFNLKKFKQRAGPELIDNHSPDDLPRKSGNLGKEHVPQGNSQQVPVLTGDATEEKEPEASTSQNGKSSGSDNHNPQTKPKKDGAKSILNPRLISDKTEEKEPSTREGGSDNHTPPCTSTEEKEPVENKSGSDNHNPQNKREDILVGASVKTEEKEPDVSSNSSGSDNHFFSNNKPNWKDQIKDASEDVCECGHGRSKHTIHGCTILIKEPLGQIASYSHMCSCKQFEPKDDVCECGHLKKEHWICAVDNNVEHCEGENNNCPCQKFKKGKK